MRRFVSKLKGIGLLELMLSLAIIAILLVMATRYFGIATKSQRIDDSIQLVSEIESGINSYITSTGVLRSNASIYDLIQSGDFAEGRIQGGKAACTSASDCPLKSIWGTAITYAPATGVITFATIPLESCRDMSNRLIGSEDDCDTSGNFTYTIQ